MHWLRLSRAAGLDRCAEFLSSAKTYHLWLGCSRAYPHATSHADFPRCSHESVNLLSTTNHRRRSQYRGSLVPGLRVEQLTDRIILLLPVPMLCCGRGTKRFPHLSKGIGKQSSARVQLEVELNQGLHPSS